MSTSPASSSSSSSSSSQTRLHPPSPVPPPEEPDDLEWEEWNPRKLPFLHHMFAGSCAGLAEHISIFPIDTLKTHVQCERCGATSPWQTWNCATRIVQREGVFRLWRGVSAMFAGCIPAHAAYFSIFESMKAFLGADKEGHHPVRAAVCGATASFSHDVCMTPFDVVKQRMQLGYYKNIHHCVTSILRSEGVAAFYLSFPTTLMMNLPFGMIMVSVNESARKVLNPTNSYSFNASMISGCIAGGVAAVMTNPLDVIKTRLQTQNLEPCPKLASGASGVAPIPITNQHISEVITITSSSPHQHNSPTYKNAMQVVTRIMQDEGLRGFWRGAPARMLVHAPSVAISWTAYETVKVTLSKLFL